MKYIVSLTKLLNLNHESEEYFLWEDGHEPPENIESETRLVICTNLDEVKEAIDTAGESQENWHVFEIVGSKPVRRAVQYNDDVIVLS